MGSSHTKRCTLLLVSRGFYEVLRISKGRIEFLLRTCIIFTSFFLYISTNISREYLSIAGVLSHVGMFCWICWICTVVGKVSVHEVMTGRRPFYVLVFFFSFFAIRSESAVTPLSSSSVGKTLHYFICSRAKKTHFSKESH